eukprot:365250-Chlamydomonas_euryale.AAC.5
MRASTTLTVPPSLPAPPMRAFDNPRRRCHTLASSLAFASAASRVDTRAPASSNDRDCAECVSKRRRSESCHARLWCCTCTRSSRGKVLVVLQLYPQQQGEGACGVATVPAAAGGRCLWCCNCTRSSRGKGLVGGWVLVGWYWWPAAAAPMAHLSRCSGCVAGCTSGRLIGGG